MRITQRALAASAFLWLTGCQGGFTAADIENVKTSIREEFDKDPNYTVLEVVMLKESATKLNGFVKLKVKLLGEVTKSCSATMAEDARNFIWRCGNGA